jgi:pseudaminic acid cytidylyltransferase
MIYDAIVIIPARGGSKRVPHKNIKHFLGEPIIKYSIDAACDSGCFKEIMVSTDDPEIAKIATCYGANVPFMRSAQTSDDYSTTVDVLKEVLLKYNEIGKSFKYLCCLYPTAPFVAPEMLKRAMALLIKAEADSVFTVTKFSYPIQRALKIEKERVQMLWPENYSKRSQDLQSAYHDCGLFYCMKTNSLMAQMTLFPKDSVPIILPESLVQDIDTEEDWKIAEMKYLMHKKLVSSSSVRLKIE